MNDDPNIGRFTADASDIHVFKSQDELDEHKRQSREYRRWLREDFPNQKRERQQQGARKENDK